mgnify:CR=1 FL=1
MIEPVVPVRERVALDAQLLEHARHVLGVHGAATSGVRGIRPEAENPRGASKPVTLAQFAHMSQGDLADLKMGVKMIQESDASIYCKKCGEVVDCKEVSRKQTRHGADTSFATYIDGRGHKITAGTNMRYQAINGKRKYVSQRGIPK